jgi:hypothetical protein
MVRQLRVQFPVAIYHVVTRGDFVDEQFGSALALIDSALLTIDRRNHSREAGRFGVVSG